RVSRKIVLGQRRQPVELGAALSQELKVGALGLPHLPLHQPPAFVADVSGQPQDRRRRTGAKGIYSTVQRPRRLRKLSLAKPTAICARHLRCSAPRDATGGGAGASAAGTLPATCRRP